MEIIKEYIFKEILLLLISLFIIEIFIVIILSKRSSIIYEETYKETEERAVQKALEATQKIEEYTNNYITRFLGDLKSIGIHSLLFNINNTNNNNILNNTHKLIHASTMDIMATLEVLIKFSRVREKSYIGVYEEEFANYTDITSILKVLLDNEKHPELNYMSYYDPDIERLSHPERVNLENRMNPTELNNMKNIMIILKSIYIKRYLIKRDILDYIRFFIINKKKMFIYPPAPYLITQQYFFDKMNPDADCNGANNPYPLCYYNYLNKN